MKIEVTGFYSPVFGTPMDYMSDMLRYDSGVVVTINIYQIDSLPVRNQFLATIDVKKHTPDRWLSFGFKTKEIE